MSTNAFCVPFFGGAALYGRRNAMEKKSLVQSPPFLVAEANPVASEHQARFILMRLPWFIGKFNLETGKWMKGPKRHKAQANAAIEKWRRENEI